MWWEDEISRNALYKSTLLTYLSKKFYVYQAKQRKLVQKKATEWNLLIVYVTILVMSIIAILCTSFELYECFLGFSSWFVDAGAEVGRA